VCAGVKSILDVGATLERLETLGVTVIGYGSRRFAGFYLSDSGFDLDWALDTPAQLAEVLSHRSAWACRPGRSWCPTRCRSTSSSTRRCTTRVLTEGLAGLARDGITGKAVTPYLLAHFHEATAGASLEVNIRVILHNAELAARIAVARVA
jgi:pseudouridine-5'-phosphate glycosidase